MARRCARVSSTLLLAAGLLLGGILALSAVMGWQRYVIVSGSMTGTYDRGSLVLDDVVPVGSLKPGDVITYKPPPGAGPDGLVTHRIVSISSGKDGQRVLRTKGDANAAPDPWTFVLAGRKQARVRAGIPYAGFVIAALSRRELRMLVVGVPALLIAFISLAGLWREAGAETAAVPR
jgi:signal peptidase I